MRKSITAILLLLAACLTSSGQATDSLNDNWIKITLDGPQKPLIDPLFILSIDKQKADFRKSELFRDSLRINPDWILSIYVVKGQEAVDRYGARAQDGALLIELKKESFNKLPEEIKRKFETRD